MIETKLNALNAYNNIGSKIADNFNNNEEVKNDSNFSQILSHLQDVSKITKAAESKSIEALAGKADIVDVVNAMTQAELAVETLVSIRDKVVETYREIINMPI